MKNRQRKKNQRWLNEWISLSKECEMSARFRCLLRGHDYIYVEWPNFNGMICLCCNDKIASIKHKKDASPSTKRGRTAGAKLKRKIRISVNLDVRSPGENILKKLIEQFEQLKNKNET